MKIACVTLAVAIFATQISSAQLTGSFPYEGGPITIHPTASGWRPKGLNLHAISGSLSGGGSPAPFSSLETNTDTQWSASSSDLLMIDGNVELDVFASSNARISAESIGRFSDTRFEILRRAEFTDRLVAKVPLSGGPVAIESVDMPFVTRELNFTTDRGTLSSGGSPGPFESLTNNTVSRWTASSNNDVIIDGRVELDLIASDTVELNAFTNNGSVTNQFVVRPEEISGIGDTALVGTYPPGGGNITITTTQGPIEAFGVRFIVGPGGLTQGASPAPFLFFIGTLPPGSVTFGVLGTPVILDGTVELDVSVSATQPEITATWGDGVVPTPFPVFSRDSLPTESTLVGSMPFDGGTITLSPRTDPVTTRGLNIEASMGTLTGGGSADPYETLVANTPNRWSVSSNVDVTIDGPIELDVIASKAAQITGSATSPDGMQSIAFSQDEPKSTNRLYATYVEDGGRISLVTQDGPVSTRTLDFQVSNGVLFDPGESVAPYDRVVTDNGKRWTITSDVDVVIDGVVTLDVEASRNRTIQGGLIDDGSSTSSFEVRGRRSPENLRASFLYDGGPVTIRGSLQEINSISLTASAGTLTSSGDASPFDVVSTNTPTEWVVESDASVFIDGWVTLDVSASADAQLQGMAQNHFEEGNFEVDRLAPRSSRTLLGQYDILQGGPVSVTSIGQPVSIQRLELDSTNGGLTDGADPAPFDTVVNDTGENWTVESLANVIVDGTVELNVQAEPGSVISGKFFDGSETFTFAMDRFDPGDIENSNSRIVAVYPPEGGQIRVITDKRHGITDFEFVAEPGVLTRGSDTGPFRFSRSDGAAPGNVKLHPTNKDRAIIDGITELNVMVEPNTPLGAITALWQNGAFPIVPEPGAILFADFDNDEFVGLSDVDLLVSAIASGENNLVFDLTNDGLVNRDDLTIFITGDLITTGNKLFGDTDFNGNVEFADFLTLAEHWRDDIAKWSVGDFDATGEVTFADFLYISQNFGQSSNAFAVPEPNGFTSILFCVLLLCFRRGREEQ